MRAISVAIIQRVRVARWARFGVAAVAIGVSIALIILAIRGWTVEDSSAYWQAALRLRAGLPLYPANADPGASDVYRYAPWFAYLWVPLTYLPKALVVAGWTILLVVASVAAVAGLARQPSLGSRLLALLLGSILVWTAARGNVQPLVILALVTGLPRKSGPIWIGLTASLKAVPIFFALVYISRREWRAAAWSIGITAVLVAPMPLFGWKGIDPGPSLSLYYQSSPVVWAAVAVASGLAAVLIALRGSPSVPIAAGVAAILALPRLLFYDVTLLAPSVAATTGGFVASRSRRGADG
jgi:hypothetical protein